jgi:hypothetical protein
MIKMKRKMNAMPFFDTGFYMDPKDFSRFMNFGEGDSPFEEISVPGGIIASDVGSGKTITTIGLITVGSQLKYHPGMFAEWGNFDYDEAEFEMQKKKQDELEQRMEKLEEEQRAREAEDAKDREYKELVLQKGMVYANI